MNNFPEDVLIKIFGYLDHVSLSRVSRVCSRFNQINNDNHLLWKDLEFNAGSFEQQLNAGEITSREICDKLNQYIQLRGGDQTRSLFIKCK